MTPDRIEGKWIDLFAEVFARCKVAPGDACAVLPESQSRALNVQLAELENVMADCPAIDEAAVLALFRDRLARYKHPRRVVFADALPKHALGKIQKHEL